MRLHYTCIYITEAPEPENDLVASYMQERQKYKNLKSTQSSRKKGSGREDATMALLNKFKSKLDSAKKFCTYDDDEEDSKPDEEEEESAGDISW